jgi:hypothetical protein
MVSSWLLRGMQFLVIFDVFLQNLQGCVSVSCTSQSQIARMRPGNRCKSRDTTSFAAARGGADQGMPTPLTKRRSD